MSKQSAVKGATCDVFCDSDMTVSQELSQVPGVSVEVKRITDAPAAQEDPASTALVGAMEVGSVLLGVTCTGIPVGRTHWLADSSVCGDMVMALPSSVLIAARTREGGGVAVDMTDLLDSIPEGVGKFNGLSGVAEAASLPVWAVSRLFGTFPVLQMVYDEAMKEAALVVEGAAFKAAIGMKCLHKRTMNKTKKDIDGKISTDTSTETLEKTLAPDATLSKLILLSRMKGTYKEDSGMRQAIVINVSPAEANV